MPDTSGSIDLSNLSAEEQEAVDKMAEEHMGSYDGDKDPENNKRKVLTGFTVLLDYDGNPEVSPLTGNDVLVQSEPTSDLIYAACSTIIKDIAASDTAQAAAQYTAMIMQQQAQAMMEQQRNAMLQRQVAGNLRG